VSSQLAPGLRKFLALPDGQRVLGQYCLLHQLGSGGFAPVWLASERYGNKELRKVAIKLFAIEGADGAREETIVEEAQALCNVEHPNVVRFYTFTKDATNKVLGLVMEYVRGLSLDKRLSECERLPWPNVVDLGIAIASALESVHRVGLVHRDLKPANVIVSEGVYKLIDFGIASAEQPARPSRPQRKIVLDDLPLEVTATKASMLAPKTLGGVAQSDGQNPFAALAGTLGYMDPHCVSSQARATAASDLYALGATLFECASGMLPSAFAAKLDGGLGLKGEVVDGRSAAPSLATAVPDAPPALVSMVDRLLDPDPVRRVQTATEAVTELSALRAGSPRLTLPSTTPAAAGPSTSVIVQRPNTGETAFGSTGGVSGPPRRVWPIIGTVGVVAALGAGALLAVGRAPSTAAKPAAVGTSSPVTTSPPAPSSSVVVGAIASVVAAALDPVVTPKDAGVVHAPAAHVAPRATASASAGTPAPVTTQAPATPGGVIVTSPY